MLRKIQTNSAPCHSIDYKYYLVTYEDSNYLRIQSLLPSKAQLLEKNAKQIFFENTLLKSYKKLHSKLQ